MSDGTPFDDDKLHEECGVFAIYGHGGAAAHAALGLHALQHRGQEAAGIVSFDGEHFHHHKATGLVGDSFARQSVIEGLPGHTAIGHTRYATTGAAWLRNVQPLFADFAFGGLAIAHNGNLTNALSLRRQLVEDGSLFHSTTDTEVIVHLIARSRKESILGRITDALRQIEGAWSLVGLFDGGIIGVRDPLGVRPARPGPPRGFLDPRVRDLRPRHPGGRFRPRRRARRDRHRGTRRCAQPAPVPARAPTFLRLRVCLLRSPR